jgi:LPS O-antigen subunit length determinant protein (WzzB/FepE family)
MSKGTKVVKGNGDRLGVWKVDDYKTIRTRLWSNPGDHGVMHSIDLQSSFIPKGSEDYKNPSVRFLSKQAAMAARACLDAAIEAWPEEVRHDHLHTLVKHLPRTQGLKSGHFALPLK